MINKIKKFGLLYFSFIIYSFASVFAKKAAGQDSLVLMLLYIGAEMLILGVYALIWQKVLKMFPLVVAMANKGVTVVIALVWSVLIFQERITLWNLIGTSMIILGIGMVSSDE